LTLGYAHFFDSDAHLWMERYSQQSVRLPVSKQKNTRRRRDMNRRNAGFTLIELIVVIAGVLGALGALRNLPGVN
jgi:prepilin-type N-terminal cleavage/methylation domain-containing protein